ncbi:MAG: FAD-dependent monooxygenase [Bdellovibrionales bacterium]|nr:FAD-dependent monooxygenase [Bdellovibrionales bacterium]
MANKITIIGAGLVGSLWAVLLRKRGIDVTVFEKRADPRLSHSEAGRSINLVITSRGVNALDKAGLLQKALELAVPVYGRMIHPKTGDLVYQPYGKESERNLSISRSALNQFLIEEAEHAGAKVYFQHSLENIDFKNKIVTFGGGEKHSYDVLFGTDGAGSAVRKQMAQQNLTSETTEWLPADYKELFLPAPNSLDKKALHIWPRGSHMMMALANLDDSFTMTLYLPKGQRPVSFENIKNTKDVENLFKNEFPDAIPMMPHYLEDFEKNPQGALGTVRCTKWVFDNSVALMGDAAHAIVPFFGQGMNSGFEDCTNLLAILDRTNNDWSKALAEYDQMQRPNANAIADMAIENWYEMSEKVADPQFQLRKKIEGLLEKNFPALFKSRYGMVTYTLIPYHLVQQAGRLQDQVLAELMTGIKSADDVSLEKAETVLRKTYEPFLKQHGL